MKLCRLSIGLLFFLITFANAYIIPLEKINEAMATEVVKVWPQYRDMRVVAKVKLKEYQQALLSVDNENIEIKVNLTKRRDISSVIYASVVFFSEGQQLFNLRCRFELQIFDQVYHAKRDYPKGSELDSEMFYFKEVDILKYSQQMINKDFVFEGQMLISLLSADKPVFDWKFRKKPIVTVGETIVVLFINDNIKIKTLAKVLQQGYIGDKIRVRIINTGKVFMAEIAGQDQFLIRL